MATIGASAAQSCAVCGKGNARRCNKCKSACYCSKACQRIDWPTHRLLCAEFATFDLATRPSKEHMRAVFFPPDEAKPRIIWLNCPWQYGGYQSGEVEAFIGDSLPRITPITHDPFLGKKLPDQVQICFRDDFLLDGSDPNKSIAAITSTRFGRYHDWRGPILAYSMLGSDMNPRKYKDLELEDFRHIANYFLSYLYEPLPSSELPKVKGVRINCLGDEKISKREHYEAVEIAMDDAVFIKHSKSHITARIGIPIMTRRCAPDPEWASQKEETLPEGEPFENQDATFLHLSCNKEEEFNPKTGTMAFGYVPMSWLDPCGSVIVVRKDKKPLHPWHMEALARYCRYKIFPYMRHNHGEYSATHPMSKEAVLEKISRSGFIHCWETLVEQKRQAGELQEVLSPYHV